MVMPTNHVIARAGFTMSKALTLWDFRNIFRLNTAENQKTSYMHAGLLALSQMLNPPLVSARRS